MPLCLWGYWPTPTCLCVVARGSGNGAPQFARPKEGFVRVLLPTRGQTEIEFTPARRVPIPISAIYQAMSCEVPS